MEVRQCQHNIIIHLICFTGVHDWIPEFSVCSSVGQITEPVTMVTPAY